MKIEDRKRARSGLFFKQIFFPYVPEYYEAKKEIVSMSAGKSVDINRGHNVVN